MSNLQRAIEIAVAAHNGQTSKDHSPYLFHPLRVMMSLQTENERIVGVLHDVVEDCAGWSFERLAAEGFSAEIIDALRAVSKTADEEHQLAAAKNEAERLAAYWNFVSRAIQNPLGKQVKLADLRDNSNLSRIENPTEKDLARHQRYLQVLTRIE